MARVAGQHGALHHPRRGVPTINAKKFDGTVAVEWLNVTGGVDAAAAWLTGHPEMVRAGMAYVGVDAQEGGINGMPDR